jgi:transcriptional regulator with XRE-family HTH domain
MNANQAWIERQTESPEARRNYERERFTIWALEEISEAMQQNGFSKADLARTLGTSRAHVTQVLSGSRNVTAATLADLAWACGVRLCVKREPLRNGDFISSPVMVVEPIRRIVTVEPNERSWASSELDVEFMTAAGGCK